MLHSQHAETSGRTVPCSLCCEGASQARALAAEPPLKMTVYADGVTVFVSRVCDV